MGLLCAEQNGCKSQQMHFHNFWDAGSQNESLGFFELLCPTGGRTGGQAGGRMDGRTDRRADGRADGQRGGRMGGWTGGWADRRTGKFCLWDGTGVGGAPGGVPSPDETGVIKSRLLKGQSAQHGNVQGQIHGNPN